MEKLKYKGYVSTVRYDNESHKLHGRIDGISDFVNYVADDINEVEQEFKNAVDDYLDFCKEVNKTPATPEAEIVDIDLPIDICNSLALKAKRNGLSLSQLITNIILGKTSINA